ncbi:hypothetical protein, partial [Nocardioides sp. AE5]|uniref:hypothetical protein n=1 Tax=Nocardioides sp. AE5 TaxID=2962573 RepID=UPI0028813F33
MRRIATVALMAGLLASCGDSDPDSTQEPGTNGTTSPTGEARGTIEIDGQAFEVALGDAPTAQCTVSEGAATVVQMTSPEGVRVDL